MWIPILVAFLSFVLLGLVRTIQLRRNPEAWPPWLACVVAALGIASVLFDTQIDTVLGETNWVFVLEMWSVYFAYALMTETCRAVGNGAPIQLRGWVMTLVTAWCVVMTALFLSLDGREGTRSHFVRDMYEQPQAFTIGLMYSLGIVILALLPLFWLRHETGLAAWLIRIGTGLVVLAHLTRFIVTPIDFFNTGSAGKLEALLYGVFVPLFYTGVALFGAGLMGLSLRRWYREVVQQRMHLRRLGAVVRAHRIDVYGDTPVAHLVAIEDAVRVHAVELTPAEVRSIDMVRDWLAQTHDAGPRMRYAEESKA